MWRAFLRNSICGLILWLMHAVSMATETFEIPEPLLEEIQRQYGDEARQRLEKWQRLLKAPHDLPEKRKLLLVNSFFNQIPFVSDQDHWGQEDYWATPFELLATNGGDCEDYTIAKYYTLRALGVPDNKLRITYVKALRINQAHMVLAYYPTPDGDPLILDNLVNQILPASQRTDLYPVYGFNGDGLWLAKQQGEGRRIGTADKLDNWRAMRDRLTSQLQRN